MGEFMLHHGWPLLVSAAAKSLLVLALAGMSAVVLRRASAAARHFVWRLAIVGLLLLPVLSCLPNVWQVAIMPRAAIATAEAPVAPPTAGSSEAASNKVVENRHRAGAQLVSSLHPASYPLPPLKRSAGRHTFSWPVWASTLWLAGFVLTLLPCLLGLVGVSRLERQSQAAGDPLSSLMTLLAKQLGVARSPRLLQGEVATPITWGWRQPVVLLPLDAAQWPASRLRAVLLHELAHIARGDWPAQMAAQLTCALYWFHPLVWLAARQARLEGERACDDCVLLAGMPASDYAQHLLEVARSLGPRPSLAVVPMAQTSQIEKRLRAILQHSRRETMVTRKMGALAVATALAFVVPLAALRPVAQAAAKKGAAKKEATKVNMDRTDPNKINPDPNKVNPEALHLLTQMAAAYQALQTYSGTEIAQGSGALGMPYEMSLTYQRPVQMALDITHHYGGKPVLAHLLLDGKALYVSSSGVPHRYTRQTQPERNYTLWQDALIIHEDVKFPIIMQMLEQGDEFAKGLTTVRPGETITLGPPGTADGVLVDTVIMKTRNAQGTGMEVWQIGHADHLLRRCTEDSQSLHQDPFHTSQTFLNVRANPVLPASTFVFAAPPGATMADEQPGGANADPAAVALLTKMYAAYDALKSFSCSLEVNLHGPSYGPNGMTITTSPVIGRATYAIQKPYRALVTRTNPAGVSRAVSDGKTLYVTTTEPNGEAAHHPPTRALPGRYLKLPLQVDAGNIAYNLANFGGLGDYGGSGQQLFVPQALLGWKVMPANGYDWKIGPPGEVKGEPVDTVSLRRGHANDTSYSVIRLAISQSDHLLRQVTREFHNGDQPVQQEFDTFTDVKVNPILPASLFVFTPAPGSQPVPVASQLTAPR